MCRVCSVCCLVFVCACVCVRVRGWWVGAAGVPWTGNKLVEGYAEKTVHNMQRVFDVDDMKSKTLGYQDCIASASTTSNLK